MFSPPISPITPPSPTSPATPSSAVGGAWSAPTHPVWRALNNLDERFAARVEGNPAVRSRPCCESLRLRILSFAGRQGAAAVRVACEKYGEEEGGLKEVAERAMAMEPFEYGDWDDQGVEKKEGEGAELIDLEEEKRKRRVLWERERAYRVDGKWVGEVREREKWEGFKRWVEVGEKGGNGMGRGRWVKRLAVAGWMGRGDGEW